MNVVCPWHILGAVVYLLHFEIKYLFNCDFLFYFAPWPSSSKSLIVAAYTSVCLGYKSAKIRNPLCDNIVFDINIKSFIAAVIFTEQLNWGHKCLILLLQN